MTTDQATAPPSPGGARTRPAGRQGRAGCRRDHHRRRQVPPGFAAGALGPVNFFATWCVPCRREHPELVRFQERHQAVGDVEVVGVVYDDSVDAVRQFKAERGGRWPMLSDPGGKVALDFGVSGVPESFLIGPDGVIVAKLVGGVRADDLDLLLQRTNTSQPQKGRT